jgi:NADPH:quinone reductase-like Zn-dependent oxidoreductase
MSNKMRAIVQDRYGPADVLSLRDIDKPEIEDNEVLVRVHAAGVDRGVWHMMTGLPYFLRLIIPGLGLRAPKNPIPGSDVAGVVEAIGKNVTRFKPGKRCSVSAWAHTPSTRASSRASSHPSQQTSASNGPRWSRGCHADCRQGFLAE